MRNRHAACRLFVVVLLVTQPFQLPAQGRSQEFRTSDEELRHLATMVPGGFGGLFFDEQGRPNIFIKDVRQRAAAIAALAPILREQVVSLARPMDVENIQTLQGEFDFPTLADYRNWLDGEVWKIAGVVWTDVNEARNRVVIGVENEDAMQKVRDVIQRLSIPAGAVVVELRQRERPRATLQDRAAAVEGGHLVRRMANNGSTYWCSVSFTATLNGMRVFVTNSHCTDNLGALDDERFYQTAYGVSSDYIGREYLDPPFTSNALCPAGTTCRRVDGVVAMWESGTRWSFGNIARTTGEGSLTISTTTPEFNIVGTINYGKVGEVVHKMGARTGWTRGTVTESCGNVAAPVYPQVYVCQDRFDLLNNEGDSGAPVFSMAATAGQVYLRGILWGATTFSNMAGIYNDLGGLQMY